MMNDKDIMLRFIKAHPTAPATIEESNKLIDDRNWVEKHYPNSAYLEPLIKYVEDLKKIYFEIESARNRFERSINEHTR